MKLHDNTHAPHVEFLSGVLERLAEHQNKKTSRLRQLNVSEML